MVSRQPGDGKQSGQVNDGEVAGFGAEFEGFFVISPSGSLQLL